ncbi:MAG: hypothetical protein ALECFALPRED_004736 [Alectoria fallacina]|uniref:D-3-phosphoglycerate dehydrogenase n=1 Tax=Alectoria fallacina TaxID=1903189 RepID=A0A8H3IWA1_9LECA|nr:MAG: hypothetical protein ALECFALPRED_004736 [Alectoria fallacina]
MALAGTIFVLDPYHEDAIELLQSKPNCKIILPNDHFKADWHELADAILIRSETHLTEEDFDKQKKLKVVVKQGVSVNNVDLEAAKKHGVMVCTNSPGLNSESVAEFTLALALTLARRVSEIDRRVRNGEIIIRSQTLGMSLFQKTIGIVGMGNIGRVVAQKWRGAMSGKVITYDPYAPEEAWSDIEHQRVQSLETLLVASDVVTLHVPLTVSIRGMIGTKQLSHMKRSTILINASRGGIVDEPALLHALKSRQIHGAALDAMEVEPPTLEAYSEFFELDSVIVTPHIGASTAANQSKSGVEAVETVFAVLEGTGEPGRVV